MPWETATLPSNLSSRARCLACIYRVSLKNWWSGAVQSSVMKWRNDLATGSSLMPNKKNPDLTELVRGRASQPVGDLIALLMLIKGLPSSYQRATCKKISNPSGALRFGPGPI